MDMTGEYRIPASRDAVWKALNDPEVLKQCIPGCEELEKKSETEYAAKVTAKVGPVKAKFGGNVKMSDLDPPNGYTISGEGSGGAAGFAKGGAKVKLAEDGGATVLSYTVNATVGGKLAQIGSRLIDSTAKKMANDFFAKFAEIVGGDAAAAGASAPPTAGAAAAVEAAQSAQPAPSPAEPSAEKKGLPVAVWVVGVIVALGVLMWLFQS
jgi:carbon monoxide dehydrogenase subunit G